MRKKTETFLVEIAAMLILCGIGSCVAYVALFFYDAATRALGLQ